MLVPSDGRATYRDPRRQARRGAKAVSELIERDAGVRCWVEALVCFPLANVVNGHPGAACVVGRRHLLSRLRYGEVRLGTDDRSRIVQARCALRRVS